VKLLVIMLFLTLSISASASEIREMDYQYSYADVVNDFDRDRVFVICENCSPAPRLKRKPVQPLSIKLSEDFSEKQSISRTIIYFGFDKHDITVEDERQLTRAITMLKEINPENTEIRVIGYTDNIGSEKYNAVLALKRAKTVAGFLRSRGIVPKIVKGKGKCCYISDVRRLNRRVEIIIDKKGAQL